MHRGRASGQRPGRPATGALRPSADRADRGHVRWHWRPTRRACKTDRPCRHRRTFAVTADFVARLEHTAFYRFTPVQDVEALIATLRTLCADLKGSILVAPEGINGMLSGVPTVLDGFERALCALPGFAGTTFKRTACQTVPFNRLKIRRKPEIVPLGIDGVDVTRGTGLNVSPAEWRELIDQPDVVLLDNRNSFECRLGRFRNAIDPGVRHFRDFPAYVRAHVAEWKAAGKRVAMYCTGGIRCEKTSAWMRELDIPVYQLEGGILHYFRAMPDAARDWEGECFVFDNRIALDTALRETATTLEDVYRSEPDGEWRLSRARQLQDDTE